MGLLESVEASPRPHRYATLVCLTRARSKTPRSICQSRRVRLRCRIAIVYRPLKWLLIDLRSGCDCAVACRSTSSVQPDSRRQVAARAPSRQEL